MTRVYSRKIHSGNPSVHLVAHGVVAILLACSMVACGDRETGIQEPDQDLGGAQQDVDRAYADGSVVRVSIADGRMMPRIGAGRSTIAVENQDTEDCVVSVEPRNNIGRTGAIGGDLDAGRAASDRDASPSPTPEQEDRADYVPGEDEPTNDGNPTAASGQNLDAGPTAGQNQRVAAGESSTLVLSLEPGTYEIKCTAEAESPEASVDPSVTTDDGLLVVVSDAQDTEPPAAPGRAPGAGDEVRGEDAREGLEP